MNFLQDFIQTEQLPDNFGGLLKTTLSSYSSFFFDYFLLSAITFAPLIVLNELSSFDSKGLSGYLAARFFDLIVFLTIPTLAAKKQVFPFATLRLFMLSYFGPSVFVALGQLAVFLLSVLLLVSISPVFLFFSFVPYLFFLFPGFFLIFNTDSHPFNINRFFIYSFTFVKNNFRDIFFGVLKISLLALLPLFIFLLFSLPGNIEIIAEGSNVVITPDTLQKILEQPLLKWGLYFIQIITRPFESIFLSFLFLSLISRISPQSFHNYAFGLRGSVGSDDSHSTK